MNKTILYRERGDLSIVASADCRLWPEQILYFEFAEGEQWTPEQVAAMKTNGGTTPLQPGQRLRKPISYTVKQGTTVAATAMDLGHTHDFKIDRVTEAMSAIEGPVSVALEPKPPFFVSAIDVDEAAWKDAMQGAVSYLPHTPSDDLVRERDAARADAETWRRAYNTMAHDRDEWSAQCARMVTERDHLKGEVDRLANGPPTQHPPEFVAKVLMDREGRRDDPMAHARLTEVIRCARLDGRKQARDEIAARDATIADLNTRLAQFTAANAPTVPDTPKPTHNPFQHRECEPWRMGPEGI
ncbi:MAG TPA: hypothetical protein VNU68_34925 [Verrucomicrobiae bacterium]|nr:hypothetical protein [Verrucomicrobiae bacterium]